MKSIFFFVLIKIVPVWVQTCITHEKISFTPRPDVPRSWNGIKWIDLEGVGFLDPFLIYLAT